MVIVCQNNILQHYVNRVGAKDSLCQRDMPHAAGSVPRQVVKLRIYAIWRRRPRHTGGAALIGRDDHIRVCGSATGERAVGLG